MQLPTYKNWRKKSKHKNWPTDITDEQQKAFVKNFTKFEQNLCRASQDIAGGSMGADIMKVFEI